MSLPVRLFAVALAFVAGNVLAQAPKKAEVLWLGHSAFRITTPGGKVIMIDPWVTTNPKTPAKWKDLDALGKIDLVLVSHAHPDHFADAPALAQKHKVPMYGPNGLNRSVVALGILPEVLVPRFNLGGTITPLGPGIKITAIHAEHSSELNWMNPATGKEEVHVGGVPMGFMIELESGFKIYHMGDTGLFTDMKFIAEYHKPDLVLIPIGGQLVMDPRDAAFAINNWLKPRFAIPIHYGTQPALKGTPEQFNTALGETVTRVFVLEPGDKLDF